MYIEKMQRLIEASRVITEVRELYVSMDINNARLADRLPNWCQDVISKRDRQPVIVLDQDFERQGLISNAWP